MDRLRTIGIVAHIDAGKTTLAEHILCDAGRQSSAGAVDEGTAAMDWMRQEQERGISIVAAATTVQWRDCELQLVDTPGHVDFTAEVERCLRVLDGLVVVIDGMRGVESQTRTIWRHADRWRCARIAFINKLDREGADFAAAVATLAAAFVCRPLPIVVPLLDANGRVAGLGHVLRGSASWFFSEPDAAQLQQIAITLTRAREVLVLACADFDEAILASFVAGREIPAELLQCALRRACMDGVAVPVVCGSALLDHGIEWLLDAVCDFLPAPRERVRTGVEEAFPIADPKALLAALVFKIEHDGREVRNYVRIFQGILREGDLIELAASGASVKIDELWRMHAARHERVASGEPGMILVLRSATELRTGDTLRAIGSNLKLLAPEFSAPVIGACFEPKTEADREPMLQGLEELRLDDPTLRIERDQETGLPLVLGMGELHLDVVADRLRARRTCTFTQMRPQVARRATVLASGAARATVHAPVGTSAASVGMQIMRADGTDPEAVQVKALPGVVLSGELTHAIVEAACLRGCSMRSVLVTVTECNTDAAGEAGEVLINQAARFAMEKAIAKAEPVILEPMVIFEVRCPQENRVSVHADLTMRNALIRHVSAGQMGAVLRGRGRLAAFLGYTTRLRSITKGQGDVQLQPDGYEPERSSEDLAMLPRI